MAIKGKYSVAVDPKIWAMAEKAAKDGGWSVSAYVEGAILWDLISDGNTEAMKIAAARIMGKLKERYERLNVGGVVKA